MGITYNIQAFDRFIDTKKASDESVSFLGKVKYLAVLENRYMCSVKFSARIYLNFPTGKLFGKLSFLKIRGGNDVKQIVSYHPVKMPDTVLIQSSPPSF